MIRYADSVKLPAGHDVGTPQALERERARAAEIGAISSREVAEKCGRGMSWFMQAVRTGLITEKPWYECRSGNLYWRPADADRIVARFKFTAAK